MKIVGLQKLTLLDYPGKVACTVFLNGCNFRCPFCHNSQLLEEEAAPVMTEDELMFFLKRRQGILDGVCITGGEPTIHPQLFDLLRKIKSMGYPVKLDTNGYRPNVIRAVLQERLADYVAMDIKNSPAEYGRTVGLPAPDLEKIGESVQLLMDWGVEYELRTTVVLPLHSEASISDLTDWLLTLSGGRRVKKLFLQPFVPRETVPVSGLKTPDNALLEGFLTRLAPCAEEISLRGV